MLRAGGDPGRVTGGAVAAVGSSGSLTHVMPGSGCSASSRGGFRGEAEVIAEKTEPGGNSIMSVLDKPATAAPNLLRPGLIPLIVDVPIGFYWARRC
jgi:hypothetical protein